MSTGALRLLVALCCLPLLTLAAPARSSPSARMWDLVRADEWDLTVRSIERRIDPLPAPDGTLVRPIGHFALFAVDLTNRTARLLAPASGDFVLRSVEGARYANLAESAAARAHATATDRTPFGDAVPPGATVTTILLFDVDSSASGLTLYFLPAAQPIQIDECTCNLPSPVRTLSSS